ncbi:MAG: hypothetical protein IT580_24035 [Verrucomicrobiales bacterium]|nr:hypothetical protein [Verrucomicrobiales bacterium]
MGTPTTPLVLGLGSPGIPNVPTTSVARRAPGITLVTAGLLASVAPALRAVEVEAPVVAWGSNRYGVGVVPHSVTRVVNLSAGYDHALALRDDGQVIAWGSNLDGERNVPADLGNVVSVHAGDWVSYALRQDGTLVGWGGGVDRGLVPVPDHVREVIAVDFASGSHALVLRRDGTVLGLGNNFAQQVDVPSGLSNVVQVSAGYGYSLALQEDGTVVAWGAKLPGLRPDLGRPVAMASGRSDSYFLQPDGSIVHWGRTGETTPPITGIVAIAASQGALVALRRDGSVVAWPSVDETGSVGRVPSSLGKATVITARGDHALALAGTPRVDAPTLSASRTVSGVAVTFPSQLGRTYRIETRHPDSQAPWIILGVRSGTSAPVTVNVDGTAEAQFVRVTVY